MRRNDFQTWIVPIDPASPESEGKWDFSVKVMRLVDGATAEDKVSGGWMTAEERATGLAHQLGLSASRTL